MSIIVKKISGNNFVYLNCSSLSKILVTNTHSATVYFSLAAGINTTTSTIIGETDLLSNVLDSFYIYKDIAIPTGSSLELPDNNFKLDVSSVYMKGLKRSKIKDGIRDITVTDKEDATPVYSRSNKKTKRAAPTLKSDFILVAKLNDASHEATVIINL